MGVARWWILAAVLMGAFALAVGCGDSGDDDDDDDDTQAAPDTCEDAMKFLFDTCFQIEDAEGNEITADDLCVGDYVDDGVCYKNCYDDLEYCSEMGECLRVNCNLDVGV